MDSILLAALEATADAMLITDLEGHAQYYNSRFLELTQFTPDAQPVLGCWHMQVLASELSNPGEVLEHSERLMADPELTSSDEMDFLDGRVIERCCQPLRMLSSPTGAPLEAIIMISPGCLRAGSAIAAGLPSPMRIPGPTKSTSIPRFSTASSSPPRARASFVTSCASQPAPRRRTAHCLARSPLARPGNESEWARINEKRRAGHAPRRALWS